jgi:hypothetical protein
VLLGNPFGEPVGALSQTVCFRVSAIVTEVLIGVWRVQGQAF